MIINDEHAETKFLKLLERPEDIARLRLLTITAAKANKNIIAQNLISQAHQSFLENAQAFLCIDGDVFITSESLSARDAKRLIDALVAEKIIALSSRQELMDMATNVTRIKSIMLQKEDHERKKTEAAQKISEEKEKLQRRKDILTSAQHFAQHQSCRERRAAHSRPHVMLIEDDHFSRRLVENIIPKPIQVLSLSTAERAISSYLATAPHLLLLDINLPDVTGHELLQEIIKLDAEACIVMLSGNADKENISQAMKLGAKGFIAKPFTREKILQYLEKFSLIKKQGE